MNWHFCIDSAEKRALDLCPPTSEGSGWGDGHKTGDGFGNGRGAGVDDKDDEGNGPHNDLIYSNQDGDGWGDGDTGCEELAWYADADGGDGSSFPGWWY